MKTASQFSFPASAEPFPTADDRGSAPDRLEGMISGRPYVLGPVEDLDQTLQQVRAYFGYVDFWSPA